jgi:hypothetical protein
VHEIAYWSLLNDQYEPCGFQDPTATMYITFKSGKDTKIVNRDVIYVIGVALTENFDGNSK